MANEFKIENNLERLEENVHDFCFLNGLIFFKPDKNINQTSNDLAFHLPVTLFPTKFSKHEFDYAQSVQKIFQKLIFNISKDHEFLRKTLKTVILVDDFTRRLWDIYEKVHLEGTAQPVSLAIIRNDFMLDQNKSEHVTQLSQIEINTISCSFGAATCQVSKLHQYNLKLTDNSDFLSKLAPNNNVQVLAQGLVNAWKLYSNEKAILVFLIIDLERNIGDQRLLEYECSKKEPNCTILRYTLKDFAQRGHLNDNKCLIIDGKEVGLIYLRAGYDPDHYKCEDDWNARLLIERSKAIKCPNIQLHLVGAKIVQQALCEPNVVEKFVSNSEEAEKIRSTFVQIYSITKDNLDFILDLIDKKCEEFVLKPQREGGGNNIYKGDIRKFVDSLSDKNELMGYILMKMVDPYVNQNYVIKTGEKSEKRKLISELGIYGYYVCNGLEMVENQLGGYLLRTKSFGVNEGGVATGFSALDSIYFV